LSGCFPTGPTNHANKKSLIFIKEMRNQLVVNLTLVGFDEATHAAEPIENGRFLYPRWFI
jgi:hypothetical protein